MTFKQNLADYVLGRIPELQLIEVATDALVGGWDCRSLRMLAAENKVDCNYQRIINLLNASLEELKITLPSKDEAVWIILFYHINNIAQRAISPREGMREIVWIIDYPTKEYVGDVLDIHRLTGMYWSHDDIDERPDEVSCDGKYGDAAHDALDVYIHKEAVRWVDEHHCNTMN